MSTEERRALALIAALLVLTGAARYLERPRPVLEDVPSVDLAALEAASRGAGAEPAKAPLDPNTASASELQRLPGVGPKLAQRIVAERGRAAFRTLEDMRRVPGVGAALLEKMAPHVSLRSGGVSAPRLEFTTSPAVRAPVDAGPVELNTATVAELQALRGIGPALAARLAARRDSLGGFASWADVDAVPGVGPALLARLREDAVLRR